MPRMALEINHQIIVEKVTQLRTREHLVQFRRGKLSV